MTLKSATRLWVDEVRSGSSYNSSNDLRLHFGLGTETHLTNIQVRWPNGNTEFYDAPASVDRLIELVEGKGRLAPTVGQPPSSPAGLHP